MSGRGRRGHGEGSVFQRSNGMWVAQVDLGWIGGRRRRRTVYGCSERDVLAKRDQLRSQLARGVNLADPPRTVEQWLNEWMHTVKAGDGTSQSTLDRYDQIVRVHLIPLVGRIKLSAHAPRDVQLMVSHLRQTAAPASVIKIHGVLRNALADAERMDLVARNVAKAVRSASLTRTERRALTPTEATSLLRQLNGDRLESVFIVALSTGLRRGEVLASAGKISTSPAGHSSFVRQCSGSTASCGSCRQRLIDPRGRCHCLNSPSPPSRHSGRVRQRTDYWSAPPGRTTVWCSRPTSERRWNRGM